MLGCLATQQSRPAITFYDMPPLLNMKIQYPDWLRKAASKGGKAKSAAKTDAARKANAARWRNHKPKRVTATPNDKIQP